MITIHLYPAGTIVGVIGLATIFLIGFLVGFYKGRRYTEHKFGDRLCESD